MNSDERTLFGFGVFLGTLIGIVLVFSAYWLSLAGDIVEVDNRHFANIDYEGDRSWYEFDPTQPIEFAKTVTP